MGAWDCGLRLQGCGIGVYGLGLGVVELACRCVGFAVVAWFLGFRV